MRRTKLILFTGSLEMGGIERNIFHLCSTLDRRRYEIEVWCNYAGQALQKNIERLGVVCRAFKEPSLGRHALVRLLRYNLPYQWRLWKSLRDSRPDILHVLGFPATYYGVLLGRLAGVRRIVFSVQDWDVWKEKSRVYRWLDSICSRLSSLVIADGKGAARLAVQNQGIQPRKVVVIYGGVDPEELAATKGRSETLKEFVLDPSRPVAAVIARLDVRKKGQHHFIRAISLVAAKAPQMQFLIVGGGPDEEYLRSLAEALAPEQRPRFAGFREDLGNVLEAVDIVVIPSLWESVPRILVEAMHCGKAVVATRVGDVEEVLDESCGILVRPASPRELAEALIALGNNPELRRNVGIAARQKIEAARLTTAECARQHDELYRGLLRGAFPPAESRLDSA